jgi:hypothetical protein
MKVNMKFIESKCNLIKWLNLLVLDVVLIFMYKNQIGIIFERRGVIMFALDVKV